MVRGHHEYQNIWAATSEERLKCAHKIGNCSDLFAVAVHFGLRSLVHCTPINGSRSLWIRQVTGFLEIPKNEHLWTGHRRYSQARSLMPTLKFWQLKFWQFFQICQIFGPPKFLAIRQLLCSFHYYNFFQLLQFQISSYNYDSYVQITTTCTYRFSCLQRVYKYYFPQGDMDLEVSVCTQVTTIIIQGFVWYYTCNVQMYTSTASYTCTGHVSSCSEVCWRT